MNASPSDIIVPLTSFDLKKTNIAMWNERCNPVVGKSFLTHEGVGGSISHQPTLYTALHCTLPPVKEEPTAVSAVRTVSGQARTVNVMIFVSDELLGRSRTDSDCSVVGHKFQQSKPYSHPSIIQQICAKCLAFKMFALVSVDVVLPSVCNVSNCVLASTWRSVVRVSDH